VARRWSLQARLLGIAAVACILAWLAGGTAVYLAAQREDARLFDTRLQDMAHTLLVFSEHELSEIGRDGLATPVVMETAATRHDRYRYQIWSREGRLVLCSANALAGPPLAVPGEHGPATRAIDGQTFRVVTLAHPSGLFQIQFAEAVTGRGTQLDLLGGYLLAALVLSAGALTALSIVLLRLVLQPLRAAVSQIEQRGPLDLRALAVQDKLPREFEPVFLALNQMLQRIDVAMQSERSFVAAAAHELRTPLAGLRAQAQLASHPEASAAERGLALQSVMEGVDQATHLVGQLLDLARSDVLAGDPSRLAEERQDVEWSAVFERAMSDLAAPAAGRRLRLTHRFDAARVSGSEFGIGLILRNLLANAIAHAPEGGAVAIRTIAEPAGVVLSVDDSGPGLDAAIRDRVFERFRRGQQAPADGCGLGLSIVKAVADAHGASVVFADSPLGGLSVRVCFPPPP
jgi:signal transduction histidine kinase